MDLPLPLEPMMAANCPLGIERSTPLRISTTRAPLRIVRVSPSTWIIGPGFVNVYLPAFRCVMDETLNGIFLFRVAGLIP